MPATFLIHIEDDGGSVSTLLSRSPLLAYTTHGAITGEHGAGLAKKRWWKEAVSPATHQAHLRLKAALDPHGILNPGKFLD
jgi:FAD/FMN-containing dehydrogenase